MSTVALSPGRNFPNCASPDVDVANQLVPHREASPQPPSGRQPAAVSWAATWISAAAAHLAARVRRMGAAWDRFWFTPTDPVLLSVIRILTGGLLCYNLVVWSLDLDAFFAAEGLQPIAAIRDLYAGRPVVSFWLWIGDEFLWPMHGMCILVAALFCAGLGGRVTSAAAFVITISYSQRVPVANFGLDQILGLLCFYLCLGPSCAALSLDSLLRRRRLRRSSDNLGVGPPRFAAATMAMRLIQLHLCAIYFWSGMSKLKGDSWWTGEALWRVLANAEYQTTDLTWMAWVPWLPFLIAHLTVLWEIYFCVLIWNLRLRPMVLAVGIGMHFGIGAFLGMWTFGLAVTFAYPAFADPDVCRLRLERFFRWARITRLPPGAAPQASRFTSENSESNA